MVCPFHGQVGIELIDRAAWPGQLDNQPIRQNMTLDRDMIYINELKAAGKTYMAPVSPWCKFIHYPA